MANLHKPRRSCWLANPKPNPMGRKSGMIPVHCKHSDLSLGRPSRERERERERAIPREQETGRGRERQKEKEKEKEKDGRG